MLQTTGYAVESAESKFATFEFERRAGRRRHPRHGGGSFGFLADRQQPNFGGFGNRRHPGNAGDARLLL